MTEKERLDEFEKASNAYLKNIYNKEIESAPFNTIGQKNKYDKCLNEINLKYKDFIKNCPDNITGVESFICLIKTSEMPLIKLCHESLLTDDLKFDILNFWKSCVDPSNE